MTFADRIKSARKKAALTMAQAAKRCGVSPRVWCYYEHGERTPPKDVSSVITQAKILAALSRK